VIFDVHSNGSISNIEFLQLPKAPLDPKAKEHLASVFQATDGKWMLNEIESGQATKKVIFSVSLVKSSQPLKARLDDQSKIVEYSLMQLPEQKKARGLDPSQEKALVLNY
jgi:hypothetical protein